jgi:hypothetical protein
VDIILVDETHSAVVHHTIPDEDNDVGADREDSMPTFTIPPRTPSIDLLALHHKRTSKRRSRASQFSTHRLHLLPHARVLLLRRPRAVPFRPLLPSFPLLLAFVVVIPAFSRPQTVLPALGVGDVDFNLDRAHNHTGAIRQ